jgi:hypothetical protein
MKTEDDLNGAEIERVFVVLLRLGLIGGESSPSSRSVSHNDVATKIRRLIVLSHVESS